MSSFGILFALATTGLVFIVPRRWGLLPLLIAATLIPRSQEILVGPLHFGVVRLVVLAGLLRVIVKGEHITGKLHFLDQMMIFFGIWFIGSGAFHDDNSTLARFGEVYTNLGIYFLCRVFLQESADIQNLFKIVYCFFLPLAAAMLVERMTGKNLFAMVFADPATTDYRSGHYRAHGPFAHAISAGTVGAVCLPMVLYFWRQDRKVALAGLAGASGIVYASGSSGPVMTAFSILGAMALWRIRDRLRAIRWLAVFVIIALDLVMNDPVYFLLGRIDITGGSTGYYRAALIRSAIQHLNEWWFAGTDYTRHWMPTGALNTRHADLVNHYVAMGVIGGLPLMLLFMGVLFAAFSAIGRVLKQNQHSNISEPFLMWTLGSILFGHAVTFLSVSYYDVALAAFFYLLLGVIGATYAAAVVNVPLALDRDHVELEPESQTVDEAWVKTPSS